MTVVETYPAQFFQRNLYLGSQAYPTDPSADLAFAFAISGDLDTALLRRCMHAAAAASPGLRTRFEVRSGRLVALVDDQVPAVVVVETADPVRAGVSALSAALDAGPLDPGGPDLAEVSLYVGPSTSCLTMRAAHLVGDALSFATVLGCVAELYAAPPERWPSIVTPLADHPGSTPAVPVLRRGKDAYREALRNHDAFSHTTLSRRDGDRIAGTHHELVVDGRRAQRLAASPVAQTFGVPTAFFTAYAATLQQLAGTKQVTLGVPVANRARVAARAVGSYVNTLALPVTIDRRDTWMTVAARVQAGTRLLMANQGLDLLGDDADVLDGRAVRLDNAVTFYDQPLGLSLPGLTVEPVPVPRTCVQYPLVVTVEDRGEAGFTVRTAVASHLAGAAPAALLDHTLQALVDDPSGPVVGPSVFVSQWERPAHTTQVRPPDGGPPGPVPAQVPSAQVPSAPGLEAHDPASPYRDVVERIWAVAARTPDAPALVATTPDVPPPEVPPPDVEQLGVPADDGCATMTYGGLVARAGAVARGLDAAKATKAVVMAVPKSLDAVVTVLGVLASGRAYVPVDPTGPPGRLRSVLTQVADGFGGPPTVVTATGEPLAGSPALGVADLATQGAVPADLAGADLGLPCPSYDPHALAYVIFTSGSTGAPKGVMVERHAIVDLLDATDAHFRFDQPPAEVWCLFHSLVFDFSVWEVFGALAHGHTLVVPTPEQVANPEAFVTVAAAHQVTVLNQTPSAFRRLRTTLVRTGQDLPHVRWVVFGGEALYPPDVSAWLDAGLHAATFVNMYGITETTVHTTVHQVRQADLARPRTSVIGQPLPGWGAVVVDELGRRCPPGIPGELLVTGLGVARGYLGRPDLTGDRFRWVVGDDGPVRAYRSGDRVCWDGDDLVYHGRVDDQLQLRGFRVEPGDVAAGLESTGTVHAAVVRAVRPDGREPFLAAWVVPKDGTDAQQVRAAAAQVLPDYMVPARIVLVDHIPTTVNGKPDLDALTVPTQPAAVPSGLSAAAQVAGVWEQVIGAGPVGVHDRFMDVGGTSMHVMEVHEALARRFDADWLTLVDLFTHPTAQQLADHIESHQAAAQAQTVAAGKDMS
ncbi:MAG: amino acid adenylation domain-containing protein [Micrococcales bacterium]|nr:amino acid adenylation domain-containing protein [Micrococcales bacterium]MCL2666366.1 amino acid adenylation domain-containing protein [Micrococcales bacterium]